VLHQPGVWSQSQLRTTLCVLGHRSIAERRAEIADAAAPGHDGFQTREAFWLSVGETVLG
jgi:hypothetical protein